MTTSLKWKVSEPKGGTRLPLCFKLAIENRRITEKEITKLFLQGFLMGLEEKMGVINLETGVINLEEYEPVYALYNALDDGKEIEFFID